MEIKKLLEIMKENNIYIVWVGYEIKNVSGKQEKQ